ncbi:LPS export ABC transporter permease LptF [Thiomicrorhabdus sp. ZW0627]|uniref:LPS export ABC transporter permease LptF n=1 Tax=Thiomicrorhabdus sp. ZW0627 TaxID=3039774 RepID=UPI002436E258|nr:LPS export ABC transporter permease LptF [Thiomicrorhabdus sp. ZW0627]MDG6773600.1 LPS export ABC transporter permease LptF [Thiomicrorhabdus sp. ZW0627]
MRILDRYLLKELFATFFAVLAVLLLITFGTETTKLLALAVEGKLPASVVFQVLLLKIPPALEVILPLVALLSVMLAVGRLYQDHEMVVMNSCGISPRYFQKMVFWFLLPVALLTALITLYITPLSYEKELSLVKEAQTSAPFAGLVSGKFNELPNNKGVLYARKIDADGRMLDVWIQYKGEDKDLILTAPQGQFEWIKERLALVLLKGKSYEGLQSNKETLTVQHFDRFEGYLPELETAAQQKVKGIWAPTSVLWNSERLEDKALIQWRVVVPMGVLILGLLGLRLSKTGPREGRFAKLFIAIVLYVIYNQLLVTARDGLSSGSIPLYIGLWPIPLLFLWYALYLPGKKKSKNVTATNDMKPHGGQTL